MRRTLLRHLALICLTAALLGGCSKKPEPAPLPPPIKKAPETWTQRIQVYTSEDMNGGAPLPVDIVTVYDQRLADFLLTVDAADYFENRGQLVRDFPENAIVIPLEIPADTFVPDVVLVHPTKEFFETYVFAFYTTPGAHRAKLPHRREIGLYLKSTDFEIRS